MDCVNETIFLSPFFGNDGKKIYFKKSHCLPWERKLRVTFQPKSFFLTWLTRSQNIRTWNFYKKWDMITSLPHNQWVQIQICFSYQLADFDGLIIECIFFLIWIKTLLNERGKQRRAQMLSLLQQNYAPISSSLQY